MKVRIKNYQAIEEAELEFKPGINSIIGSTNNGKSAIIRAIRGAINNQGGNGFINYEADACSVYIEFNNHDIEWKKTRKQGKSSYTIDGIVLSKIGQTQLDEVASIMNMPEIQVNNDRHQINFWRQMDKPFLVDKTPYQLFDFIVKSDEQEIIRTLAETTEASLKEINRNINTTSTGVDMNTESINNLVEELKGLKKFNSIDTSKLELMLTLEKTGYDLLTELHNIKYQSSIIVTKVLKLTELVGKALDILLSVEATIGSLAKLEAYSTELDYINKTAMSITSQTDTIRTAIKVTEDKLLIAKQLLDEEEILKQEQKQISVLFKDLQSYEKQQVSLFKTQEEIEKRLSKILEGLKEFTACPLCGNNLDSNHGGHDELS